jgi:CheY-like chemotaxis protein
VRNVGLNTGKENAQETVRLFKHASPNRDLRILLAEDNLLDQEIARRMLRILGYEVDIVENGLEAVQAIKRTAYDLMVIDIHMPEMNGIEAVRSIRKLRCSALKIILITSGEPNIYRDLCLEAGADEFLCKPLTISELKAAIERIMNITFYGRVIEI